jgi:hypothetical protein
MLSFKLDKLFDFMAREGNCECCGMPCKTALCDSCQKDLNQAIDEAQDSTEEFYDKTSVAHWKETKLT